MARCKPLIARWLRKLADRLDRPLVSSVTGCVCSTEANLWWTYRNTTTFVTSPPLTSGT